MSPDNSSYTTPSKLVPNRPLTFDTPVKSVKIDDEFGGRGSSSTRDSSKGEVDINGAGSSNLSSNEAAKNDCLPTQALRQSSFLLPINQTLSHHK